MLFSGNITSGAAALLLIGLILTPLSSNCLPNEGRFVETIDENEPNTFSPVNEDEIVSPTEGSGSSTIQFETTSTAEAIWTASNVPEASIIPSSTTEEVPSTDFTHASPTEGSGSSTIQYETTSTAEAIWTASNVPEASIIPSSTTDDVSPTASVTETEQPNTSSAQYEVTSTGEAASTTVDPELSATSTTENITPTGPVFVSTTQEDGSSSAQYETTSVGGEASTGVSYSSTLPHESETSTTENVTPTDPSYNQTFIPFISSSVQYETTSTEFPDVTPTAAPHDLILGEILPGDELLYSGRFAFPKNSSGVIIRNVTLSPIDFARYNCSTPQNNTKISYIEVKNADQEISGGYPSVISGGLGYPNVTIRVISKIGKGLNFTISLYGNYSKNATSVIEEGPKNETNSLIIGESVFGERLLYSAVLNKRGYPGRRVSKYFRYSKRPTYDYFQGRWHFSQPRFTHIEIVDLSENGTGGTPILLRGGIGYKFVAIQFESERNFGLNFKIDFYGI